jgi:hypothetical protein
MSRLNRADSAPGQLAPERRDMTNYTAELNGTPTITFPKEWPLDVPASPVIRDVMTDAQEARAR